MRLEEICFYLLVYGMNKYRFTDPCMQFIIFHDRDKSRMQIVHKSPERGDKNQVFKMNKWRCVPCLGRRLI